jgi:RNA polymerase sigma-70 factor (ECF subfamily)
VDNLGGWLTTVVARICLDMLRSRKTRREEPLDLPAHGAIVDIASNPEREAAFADSVGIALLVVLQTLSPAERVAFVLHDMFDLPFEEIAAVIGRSAAAARQLASRARRRVQGQPETPDIDLARKRSIAEAFLIASRNGDLEGLLAVLAPDAVFRPDAAATRLGNVVPLRGAGAIAESFKGRATSAKVALVDGEIVFIEGQLRVVLALSFDGDRISAVDAIADQDHLRDIGYSILEG